MVRESVSSARGLVGNAERKPGLRLGIKNVPVIVDKTRQWHTLRNLELSERISWCDPRDPLFPGPIEAALQVPINFGCLCFFENYHSYTFF